MIQQAQERFNTNGGANMVDPAGDGIKDLLKDLLNKMKGEDQ